tara:strand:- start:36 stop:203 length:168 start_codon:yes stop_codon:yes gene_type:complete
MSKKSNTDKRKEAEAAGRVKQTKQQQNAGKSQTQKKAEQKAKKAAKNEKNGLYGN